MKESKKHISVEITEVGIITDIKRDVITIKGIPTCVYGELLEFESGDKGIVIEFDEEKVVALLLGSGIDAKVGDKAVSRGELFKVPVTEKFVGRIVNGVAQAVDGKGPIRSTQYNSVFKDAVPIMDRVPITESLKTGIKIIDTMVSVGKGQRELIIGDRQTGKTTIAIDSVMNQKDENVICIYCWIGGSYTSMVKIIESLDNKGALGHTIVVAAPASASSTEQYLAPYTACALGEYFVDRKKDVLVIFDNLTKHAWIYRQISLLLNRSPGREAYPGDIFYVHSQLMERACRMDPNKGGSMTFLPIADTLQGDITGYIQTNLVSMTDGQIYTSSTLFNEGFRPAVDIGLSVSRIGSKVQSSALKEVSVKLRLEYAQFKELQKLTKMRAKISTEIAKKISRGQTLSEILIQPANAPVSEIEEILVFYAFDIGVLDPFGKKEILNFERNILKFIEKNYPELLGDIKFARELTPHIKKGLNKAFVKFFEEQKIEI
ncbi:MAG: F0F1 ATP synthase subunit alpha [Candidatus Omnitrophota bacterium]